jgi:hypothetical protein
LIGIFQLLPIFTIVALVSTYFCLRTGQVQAGSFIKAMVGTWIVLAGQAPAILLRIWGQNMGSGIIK